VHSDWEYSDLAIELYDNSTSAWVTVWEYRLENPNYPDGSTDAWLMNQVDVTFPRIDSVNGIRVTSDPGSDNTYHSWEDPALVFNFYQ